MGSSETFHRELRAPPIAAALGWGALGLAGLLLGGCGDGKPTRVPVSGTVLVDGQPLTYGSIMFVSPDARPSGGSIDPDGRFVLSCYEPGDGAVLGHHRVKIMASESLSENSARWHAPKKYANADDSGIEVEISKPVDDLTIELTWDGGKPFVEQW